MSETQTKREHASGRDPLSLLTERVWTFDVACSDGGAHTIVTLVLPLRCSTCGVEAVERERRLSA
jgi:hypothetical protein